MRKKLAIPAFAILVSVAVAIAVLAFQPLERQLVVENTVIDSGGGNPYALFGELSKKSVFIVSPQMNESATSTDHLMFNATALFLQVLEGNDRKAIQVIRVYDKDRALTGCFTNYGDLNRSEALEKEACLEYISPENGAIILIEFPDESLQRPVLEISGEKLTVRPKESADISNASFLALRILFRNSREIVDRSNFLLGGIK